MFFWKIERTQSSYRSMQYDDVTSPVKEILYITDKRLLKKYPDRSYVTKRFVKCTKECFVQSLYNEDKGFLQAENLLVPNRRSFVIKSDWRNDRFGFFSTPENVYTMINVRSKESFPAIVKSVVCTVPPTVRRSMLT